MDALFLVGSPQPMIDRSGESAWSDPLGLPLKSFPTQSVQLPDQCQIVAAAPIQRQPLDRSELIAQTVQYLDRLWQQVTSPNPDSPPEDPRVLLLLPDKTRTPVAARLLVDAVLAWKIQYPNLSITLLFGLGTHPLMTEAEIADFLGHDRYEQLCELGIEFKQQTTLITTIPLRAVRVWEKLKGENPDSFEALNQAIELSRQQLAEAIERKDSLRKDQNAEPNTLEGMIPEAFWYHRNRSKNWAEQFRQSLNALHFDKSYLFSADAFSRNPSAPKLWEPLSATLKNDRPSEGESVNPSNSPGLNLSTGRLYQITLPQDLWCHDLILIAGDTKLHPYEGRGGSGGINKMLAVGIASINTIRRTHSTKVLLDKSTRVGNANSYFVHSIETIAQDITQALLHPPHGEESRLKTAPLGLSVVAENDEAIVGYWLGQDEPDRQRLTQIVQESYTHIVHQDFQIVISDVDSYKATDILAGARALQYMCNWDSTDNPLLRHTSQQRVALLFNPCNESHNGGGVGNLGTKFQLDVLGAIVQDYWPTLAVHLEQAQTLSQVLSLLHASRNDILKVWSQHLKVTSEADDFFDLLRTQLLEIRNFRLLGLDDREVRDTLQSTLATYASSYNEVERQVRELLELYRMDSDLDTLLQRIAILQARYAEHPGLGEGGQRSFRLLELCRYFQTFILATDNPTVLGYLRQLDPSVQPHLPAPLQTTLQSLQVDLSLLGLRGVDITGNQAQKAIDLALHYGRWQNPGSAPLNVIFLRDPLILRRS